MNRHAWVGSFYDLVTGDEDARVCKDIPDAACNEQPGNFVLQLGALVCTKIGDEIASAKLVLPWLLSAAGAPAFFIGLLVPIRESLSLLPQLFVAAAIRARPTRKWLWVGGSIVQGLCVAAFAGVALALEGAAAGWAVVGLLALFAIARGVSSVAAKDVMGKTVSKTRRGTLTGYATAMAGLVTALLVSTALLVPFYAVLAREQTDAGIGGLGALLVAAGVAAAVSSGFWGRMADRSSRTAW